MSTIRIQGPLGFPGYTQTNGPGINTQVLTYTNGQADWQNLPGAAAADQLPCFFTYLLNGIEVKVPATLYAKSGAIPASNQVYNPDEDKTTLTLKPIPVVNGALPCRVFSGGSFTDDNITLRT